MNREKAQTIINQIISDLHERIGGKAARKQYTPAKHQIQALTELGIIDLMPAKFGHADAKAVIEEAQNAGGKQVGGFNAYGEGDVTTSKASKLYQAINEVEIVTVEEIQNEVTKTGATTMVNAKELKKGMTVRILDHTWYDFHVPGVGTLVNPVNQYAIETTEGMFQPEQLELAE